MQLMTYIAVMTAAKVELNEPLATYLSKRDRQQRNGSDVGHVYDMKAVIRQEGSRWCVRSHKGKNLGCGKTKAWAHRRLAQVEIFKKRSQ